MLTKTAINYFGGLDKKIQITEVWISLHTYHFFLDKAILCSGLPVLCPEVHSCNRELQALAIYIDLRVDLYVACHLLAWSKTLSFDYVTFVFWDALLQEWNGC